MRRKYTPAKNQRARISRPTKLGAAKESVGAMTGRDKGNREAPNAVRRADSIPWTSLAVRYALTETPVSCRKGRDWQWTDSPPQPKIKAANGRETGEEIPSLSAAIPVEISKKPIRKLR